MISGVVDFIGSKYYRKSEVASLILGEHTSSRDSEPFIVGIVDTERKLGVGVCLKEKDEFFDDETFWFDIVVIFAGVAESQFECGTSLFRFGDPILGDS